MWAVGVGVLLCLLQLKKEEKEELYTKNMLNSTLRSRGEASSGDDSKLFCYGVSATGRDLILLLIMKLYDENPRKITHSSVGPGLSDCGCLWWMKTNWTKHSIGHICADKGECLLCIRSKCTVRFLKCF